MKVWAKDIVRVLTDGVQLLLVPLYIYSGISQAFMYGEFTSVLGRTHVGQGMIIFGVGEMMLSIVGGRLIDIAGRSFGLIADYVLVVLSQGLFISYTEGWCLRVDVMSVLT